MIKISAFSLGIYTPFGALSVLSFPPGAGAAAAAAAVAAATAAAAAVAAATAARPGAGLCC